MYMPVFGRRIGVEIISRQLREIKIRIAIGIINLNVLRWHGAKF